MATSSESTAVRAPETDAPPTRVAAPAGIRSPTVVSLHVAGWLVLLCFFLPLSRGCNGTVQRPIDNLSSALTPPVGASDTIELLSLLSVYGNGVLVACLITITAWLASPTFWWRSFLMQFALSLGLAVAILCVVLSDPRTKSGLGDCLRLLPPFVAGSSWVWLAIRRGERQVAWARLQHAWTIAALVYLHLQCIFASQLLIGYWLTLVGLASLVVSVELARHRIPHDLWDAAQPASQPQFTLRSVFFWTTFVSLVFGYYQAIEPFLDWVYGEA